MGTGYCTAGDLRRALRKANLPGDAAQDPEIATDAIEAQTEWLEKTLKRHWYEPNGISGQDELDAADQVDIPTSTKSRNDEESIATKSAMVVDGSGLEPRTHQADYARIELARRDAGAVSKLLVADGDGGYTDWVASTEYDVTEFNDGAGVGADAYVRVNNGGWSYLYIDVSNLWDAEKEEYIVDSWANSVYVTFEYGHEGLPMTVRRAVAFRAASTLVDDAVVQIPDNAEIRSAEAKADQLERKADELLEVYR